MACRRLLIVDVAALSAGVPLKAAALRATQSVFPAVTCTAQASFRTASAPGEHGMIANGLLQRELRRVMFWEQSSGLVAGRRIWDGFRQAGGRVGMLFWQQSLGEDVDLVLSPAPIHKHHGGMIEDCYSKPSGLYRRLCAAVGRAFRLRDYWGPLASAKAGDWIAEATAALIADPELAPELCLTYLPTLDYDFQRHGPDSLKSRRACEAVDRQLATLLNAAVRAGYEVMIFGDYAIAPARTVVLPNVALRQAGLLTTRDVRGMVYADLHDSRAFAMADHEIAHVYIRRAGDTSAVKEVLEKLPGVAEVLDRDALRTRGVGHPNGGELLAVAEEGAWIAYPWWTAAREAPDYAAHVDIHNKPGFDPCELLFDRLPWRTCQDATRIRGTHGRIGPGREVGYFSTIDLPRSPENLIDLAAAARDWLDAK